MEYISSKSKDRIDSKIDFEKRKIIIKILKLILHTLPSR
ncbi:hypothetical protein LEP1GSC040_0863 [Leptospira santarosai str. 2000030832]|uniref:Uncharacterized protein n=1 Tax=Leptospira santarosai serovar Arenal str. MAVJ 401 TaxID=1049976 RepID=M6JTK3_9LEPT|nr:hypothetical protein LEP1GSC040_0863 [Leptospira santarosai str. 2000030832]EMN22948.1 hypothetical protein LEP1GSC063_0639 [Leptospira santarosai serovar Arenal str. MAVJ 401]